jgi:hypothetical protein
LYGAKRETGGLRERADAEAAHYALDRLESHLPKAEVSDTSFNRMGKLRMRWPDGPRTPQHKTSHGMNGSIKSHSGARICRRCCE